MRTGRKCFLLLLVIGWGFVCSALPQIVLDVFPRVEVSAPRTQLHIGKVTASGVLCRSNTREITMEWPMITESVLVEEGDYVSAGQILAKMDRTKTLETILHQDFSADLIHWEQLLDQFGYEDIWKTLTDYLESLTKIQADSLSTADFPEYLVSPIDGVVSSVGARENTAILPLTPAFTVTPNEPLYAQVAVREVDIGEIAVGQRATVYCSAYPNKPYPAVVVSLASSADQKLSGTIQETMVHVTLQLQQPDEQLKEGYSIRAVIQTGAAETVCTIPYECIAQDEKQQEYVYVLENGRSIRRNITIGRELSEGAEVIDGISENEWMVCQPERLQDGQRIVIRPES